MPIKELVAHEKYNKKEFNKSLRKHKYVRKLEHLDTRIAHLREYYEAKTTNKPTPKNLLGTITKSFIDRTGSNAKDIREQHSNAYAIKHNKLVEKYTQLLNKLRERHQKSLNRASLSEEQSFAGGSIKKRTRKLRRTRNITRNI
jgi:hypothetical protein